MTSAIKAKLATLRFSAANSKLVKLVKDAKRFAKAILADPTVNRILRSAALCKAHIVSFALPAYRSADGFVVCHGAGICAGVCYAMQGAYLWSAAKALREANLATLRGIMATHSVKAIALAIGSALPAKARIVRIHDSGDFFDQRYLDAWKLVAYAERDTIFYCYTKAFDLDWRNLPDNFRVSFSEGSKWDSRLDVPSATQGAGILIDRPVSRARIFASAADRDAAGYVDGDTSDWPCILGMPRIGFVYHGTKNLTPLQIEHLR